MLCFSWKSVFDTVALLTSSLSAGNVKYTLWQKFQKFQWAIEILQQTVYYNN